MKPHRNLKLRIVLAALAAGAAFTLGGCAVMDPFERPGVWNPTGANDLNRELMVARPTDLVQGRGTTDADGQTAAMAVDRLIHDHVKSLPQTETSTVGGGSSSGGSSGSGGS